jgi:hypothetical protein|tara:strand:- start:1584 stop:2237 length:654 start_codon:yes stop_codon:yes gene_type:complete
MARKTLLTESEIRQFMKLANLSPIGGTKLQEMGYEMPGARDDEEHVEDDLHATEDELGAEDHIADEEDGELEMADDELADDDADMSGIDDSEREGLMADVVAAVADALGISDQVSIEAGAEGGDLDEPAVDDLGMDDAAIEMEPVEGGEEIELGGGEEEEEIEEPMMEKSVPGRKEVSEDEIVAEVTRRVAKRLKAKGQREQMVDKLAERIMKRLTK